jgi:hypothetical protein
VEVVPLLIKALPFLAGLIVLIKAKAIAAWVSDKLDL